MYEYKVISQPVADSITNSFAQMSIKFCIFIVMLSLSLIIIRTIAGMGFSVIKKSNINSPEKITFSILLVIIMLIAMGHLATLAIEIFIGSM